MGVWKINDTRFEADEINPELAVSPWSGHRQFAYDLIEYVKPKRVVELGTHYGCSFFAFLQVCKDLNYESEIIAVDSWEGDIQAGFYGDEVWNIVNETLDKKFRKQNFRLIRKYFQDALDEIEDESIDILHIDGLHTYEAVSDDFRMWLCKLKKDGIVLFHDIASILGYGTNVFWKEVIQTYKSYYMFEHSWGLGVLFPKGDKFYNLMEQENMRDKILIYQYSAELNLTKIQLKDHVKMVEERDKLIKSTERIVEEKEKLVKLTEGIANEKSALIKKTEELVDRKDIIIKNNENMIQERDILIRKTENMIRDRDYAIKNIEKTIEEKDILIKKTENLVQEKDVLIRKTENMVKEKNKRIDELQERYLEQNNELQECKKQIILLKETAQVQIKEIEKKAKYIESLMNRKLINRIKNDRLMENE